MVRVKICGITNLEDALAAVAYGADALGFVFAPSPRQVTVKKAKRIVDRLPPFICKVGVFVNSELAQVKETMSQCNLDLAQLHGEERADYCAALFPKAIKVFTSNNLPSETELRRYRVAAYMLDIGKKSRINETEQKQLWQLARRVEEYGPVILAGGLTPDNVSEAIKIAHPYAVDVSSGVESVPGKKDHSKMRAFLTTARQSYRIAPTFSGEHAGSPLREQTFVSVGADQCVCPKNSQSPQTLSESRKQRRSIRLREYDYSQPGAYFITICTQNRVMYLNNVKAKSIVQKWWDVLQTKFPEIQTDEFVIMPNHIHGVIFITPEGQSHGTASTSCEGEHAGSPLRQMTLGKIVQWFKTMTTNEYVKAVRAGDVKPISGKLWQRNYYEHIIRNETDLKDIQQYIVDNPAKWEEDEYNPHHIAEDVSGR